MSALYPQDDTFRSVESTRVSVLTQMKSATYSSTVTFPGLLACPWPRLCQHTLLAKAVHAAEHAPASNILRNTDILPPEKLWRGLLLGVA